MRHYLDIRPSFRYITARIISPGKGHRRGGKLRRRGEGGARERACNPLPVGLGIDFPRFSPRLPTIDFNTSLLEVMWIAMA